jgi:hypothetical protein
MTQLHLVNSGAITNEELSITRDAVQDFTNIATKYWPAPSVSLVTSGTVSIPDAKNIYITDDKINAKALGYHVANPVAAFISPKMNRVTTLSLRRRLNLLGTVREHPGLNVKNKVIIAAKPTLFIPGMISVICHEIVEMLADPNLDNWKVMPDGSSVLVEVGDHANAFHFKAVITSTIKGKVVTNKVCFPDFTLPSFYDAKGVAPFSYTGAVTAPFTFLHGCYAYILGKDGARLMQFAEAGDPRR